MKTKISRALNKYIVFLLSVIGFSLVCNQCAAQYGVPIQIQYKMNQYKMKGVVKSEKDSVIKNIRVIIRGDTIYTDTNGCFKYIYKSMSGGTVHLNFTDIDGKKNGNYLPKDTTVFIKPEQELNTDVILKKKD